MYYTVRLQVLKVLVRQLSTWPSILLSNEMQNSSINIVCICFCLLESTSRGGME